MPELILGESLEILVDHRGKTPKKLGGDFTFRGVPVASAMLVQDGRLRLGEARYVSEDMYRRWMQVRLRRNDVLLTSEAPLGRVALVPDDSPLVLGQRLFGLRGKPGLLDSVFLYYALQSDAAQSELRGRSSGTTVTGIRQSELVKVRINAPGFAEQQAIAAVLKALDDKIAINDRISSTAISLAESFFEDHSANLDFGPETFDRTAFVYGGGTPRTSEKSYWDGDIAWTTPTDVTALSAPYLFKTSRTITNKGLANCASRLYPCGSIFMTSRATIGAFAVSQIPAAVNQGFIVVVPPRVELRWWLFHEMRSRVDEMLSLANGSTFPELSRKNFKAMPVRIATADALKEFDAKVSPLHQRAAQAAQESVVLAALRDILLPKLMSGAIRVRDAEKVVGDVT